MVQSSVNPFARWSKPIQVLTKKVLVSDIEPAYYQISQLADSVFFKKVQTNTTASTEKSKE